MLRHTANALRTMGRPQTVFLSGGTRGFDEVLAAFDAWCAARAGISCEVALSSFWVRTCVPPPEAGTLTTNELRDYALRQFEHYFGDPQDQGDEDAWVVAASSDPHAPLACGTPRTLFRRVLSTAAVHRVKVKRLSPWWAKGVAKHLRHVDTTATVAAFEPGVLTRVRADAGRICRVWTEVAAIPSDTHAIIRLWQENHPIPLVCDAPAVVRVIRGQTPAEQASSRQVESKP